ncbi:DoxX family membrane protein [Schumannella soli]|uniref:DoxX family membrane protein n=1 Tax=Schumannella soli TaxID=2590779 RepID=A0A506Y5L3_9MICO|nr:DoxX family membrane protein [Schumannella soli]TPW77153.1 DoxX family membrane protein [Schumannella soli]
MTAVDLIAAVLRVVLAVLFVGMGVAHFVPSVARGMRAMIPPMFRRPGWPSPHVLVVLTGLCEILGGIGLLVPGLRLVVGVLLVLFLIAVFPANAYAAANPERFGRAAIPLVPRLVGQVVLGALVLLAAFG